MNPFPCMKTSTKPTPSKAFTLVELLLTVAILLIMAALLAPAVSRIRATGRQIRCLSNLRQIGVAMFAYANDNQGKFPWAGWSSPDGTITWDDLILPYLGTSLNETEFLSGAISRPLPILECPSDRSATPSTATRRSYSMARTIYGGSSASAGPPVMVFTGPTFSLAWSYARATTPPSVEPLGIGLTSESADPPFAFNVADIGRPSETILLTEQSDPLNLAGGYAGSFVDNPDQQQVTSCNLHNGRFNYLFVDGHVKYCAPEETIGTGTLVQPKGMWTVEPSD